MKFPNSQNQLLAISQFLKISENSPGNTCVRASFLLKLQAPGESNQVGSEFCEISKNIILEHVWSLLLNSGKLYQQLELEYLNW